MEAVVRGGEWSIWEFLVGGWVGEERGRLECVEELGSEVVRSRREEVGRRGGSVGVLFFAKWSE